MKHLVRTADLDTYIVSIQHPGVIEFLPCVWYDFACSFGRPECESAQWAWLHSTSGKRTRRTTYYKRIPQPCSTPSPFPSTPLMDPMLRKAPRRWTAEEDALLYREAMKQCRSLPNAVGPPLLGFAKSFSHSSKQRLGLEPNCCVFYRQIQQRLPETLG